MTRNMSGTLLLIGSVCVYAVVPHQTQLQYLSPPQPQFLLQNLFQLQSQFQHW